MKRSKTKTRKSNQNTCLRCFVGQLARTHWKSQGFEKKKTKRKKTHLNGETHQKSMTDTKERGRERGREREYKGNWSTLMIPACYQQIFTETS